MTDVGLSSAVRRQETVLIALALTQDMLLMDTLVKVKTQIYVLVQTRSNFSVAQLSDYLWNHHFSVTDYPR